MPSLIIVLLLSLSHSYKIQASGCIPETPPVPEINALSPHEGPDQTSWTKKTWESVKGAAREVTNRFSRTLLRERTQPQEFPMDVPTRLQLLPIFKPEFTVMNSTIHYAHYLEETNCEIKESLAKEISRHILESPPNEMRQKILEIRLVTEQMREKELLTEQNRADIDELNKQLVTKIQIQEEWSENRKKLTYATIIGGMALISSMPSATSFRLLATKTADLFSPLARVTPAFERNATLEWLAALDEGANTGNWTRVKVLREKAIPMPEMSDELKIQLMERGRQTEHAKHLLTLLEQAPPPPGMNRLSSLWDTYVAFYSLKEELPHGIEYFEKMVKDITKLPDLGGVQLQAIESEKQLVDFIFARDFVSLKGASGATHHGTTLPLTQVPLFLKPKPTNIEGVYSYVFNTGDGVRVALRLPRTAEEQTLAQSIYPKLKDKFDGIYVGIKRIKVVRLPSVNHGPTASIQMIYESANQASRANMKRIAERIEASLDESLSLLSAEGITPTGLRLQQLTNSQVTALQAISGGIVGLGAATALENYNLLPGEKQEKLTRAELADILENGLTPLQTPQPSSQKPSPPVTPEPRD